MSFNPLNWGARALTAAVQLRLKSAVRSALVCTFTFTTLLFTPLLTEDFYVRAIVTVAALAGLVSEFANIVYRSWASRERN